MKKFVCPWWIGFFLINPLRKRKQDPFEILKPFIKKGMSILDIGPGMGYFSIPMAEMTGKGGRVICVDMQEKMLEHLRKRAEKAGVSHTIQTRTCSQDSLELEKLKGQVDFVLLFAMVHEVPDPERFFNQLKGAVKKGGKVLFAEPRGHVTRERFEKSLSIAQSCGFTLLKEIDIWKSHAAVLVKK